MPSRLKATRARLDLKILTTANPKIILGLGDYFPIALMISPADRGGYEVCAHASPGCRFSCLNVAGQGGMMPGGYPADPDENTNKVQTARLEKKRIYFEERPRFWKLVEDDIHTALDFCKNYVFESHGAGSVYKGGSSPNFRRRLPGEKEMTICLRMNAVSDIPWERVKVPGAENIMVKYPMIQFYDYTKWPGRFKLPKNYHLTYSRSEKPESRVQSDAYYDHGVNTAVVFDNLLNYPEYWGKPVFNGKNSDLRFLDPFPCIVGLSQLGFYARRDESGFIVRHKANVNPRLADVIDDSGGELFPDIP
jgi:hypothetical protein